MIHRWSPLIRRCLVIAAALAILAGGLAPKALATSPTTVLTPTIIDLNDPAKAELPNPGRGLYKWRTPLYVCDPARIANRDAYERWEWKQLETAQGVYDWSGIQAKLTEAQGRGQKLWIGLAMAVVPPSGTLTRTAVPAYMVQPGWGEWYNNAWYPNYNNTSVQTRMEAMLDSFVAAFPNDPWIAGVQMRTYGQYGEIYIPWDAPSASPIRATPATAEWMINAWHSRLINRYRLQIPLTDQQASGQHAIDHGYVNNNQYIFQYAMSKTPEWGWYRDALGHTGQMANIDRAMASTATINGVANIGAVIRERWKTQPVFTEMIGGYMQNQPLADGQAQFALAATHVLSYHVSLVSNGNFVNQYAGGVQVSRYTDRPFSVNGAGQCVQRTLTAGSPVDWTQQNISDFVLAGKRSGYRYAIPQVVITNPVIGQTTQISTTWRNDGAAPIYEPAPVTFQLRSGAQIVWQGVSAANLQTILPAETPGAPAPLVAVADSFTLPTTMTAGLYALHAVVGPTAPFTTPLHLAIEGRQADGSYLLGNVAVQPTVAFAFATTTINEGSPNVTVEIRLSAPSTQPVTVNYATSEGTAYAGVDFTASSGTVTFSPGQTSRVFSVPILEDTSNEVAETFTITLSNPTNAQLGTPATIVVTIPANDQITVASSAMTVHESAGTAAVVVTLNSPPSQPVTVNYTVGGGTANSGDYFIAAQQGTLTFSGGQTSKTISILMIDDQSPEGAETFTVALSFPSNAQLGWPSSTTITIPANDSLSMQSSALTVHENAGTAAVVVKLNAPASQTVTVNYATSAGTATAGSDFTAGSGTVTFAPGQTSRTISVPILEDSLQEAAETFTVALSSPANAQLGSPTSTVVTIAANDSISFTVSTQLAYETAGSANLRVELNAPSSQTVTVQYAIIGGTATAGGDYILAPSGTVTFSPGQTLKSIPVALIDDGDSGEPDETLRVQLSSPGNAKLGSITILTLTIREGCSPTIC